MVAIKKASYDRLTLISTNRGAFYNFMQQINTCLVGQKILLDFGSNRTRLPSPT